VQAYAFYPGALRNAVDDNDLWLASGHIEAIEFDAEEIAGNMTLAVHDYQDVGAALSDGRLIAGGTAKAPGRLTVTGAGAMIALADGTPTFECYGTNAPAVFVNANRKAAYTAAAAGAHQILVEAPCLNGMAIIYSGTTNLVAAHRLNVIYRPSTYGGARSRMYRNRNVPGRAYSSW
jgi:hypothetical protein